VVFGAVSVIVFVSFWGCFQAVFVRFSGVLLFELCSLLFFTCFSVFYDLLLFDLFVFFVYFFVFQPLADIFLPPLFLSRFCGIYFFGF
jgi:hypothetical protein